MRPPKREREGERAREHATSMHAAPRWPLARRRPQKRPRERERTGARGDANPHDGVAAHAAALSTCRHARAQTSGSPRERVALPGQGPTRSTARAFPRAGSVWPHRAEAVPGSSGPGGAASSCAARQDGWGSRISTRKPALGDDGESAQTTARLRQECSWWAGVRMRRIPVSVHEQRPANAAGSSGSWPAAVAGWGPVSIAWRGGSPSRLPPRS